ncbi:hypothetical protein HU200_004105 [Digitaria exilis]|uniref:Uncharacterized protein n=1 Tax=Digitaria exilis TaxID=1010633 RepID=A0A835FT07_9POAL|nr:hypothetical protein HU200_004105 [Digitaria exilis]
MAALLPAAGAHGRGRRRVPPPPNDPARLVGGALVCKRWFRCRFREFCRTLPVLGFISNIADRRVSRARLVPRPPSAIPRRPTRARAASSSASLPVAATPCTRPSASLSGTPWRTSSGTVEAAQAQPVVMPIPANGAMERGSAVRLLFWWRLQPPGLLPRPLPGGFHGNL